MAEAAPSAGPSTPPGASAGGSQAQQPPFGSSPVTGPTPNKGFEAAGVQRLGAVIKQLEQLIPMLGASSESGRDVLKALNILVKHVPGGTVSPQAEKNHLQQMQLQNAQRGQMMQKLQQPQPGGAPGAASPPQAA